MTKQKKQPLIPAAYYYMSSKPLAVGDIIPATGQEKLPAEFEEPLERHRPTRAEARRSFVYCRPNTIFHRCGIVGAKNIYRLEPTDKEQKPQIYDLAWIGPMQMAKLREKYRDKYLEAERFPQWSSEMVEECCNGYWSGTPAKGDDPVWEYLFPSVRVVEVISDQPVDPKHTRDGWPPPNRKAVGSKVLR